MWKKSLKILGSILVILVNFLSILICFAMPWVCSIFDTIRLDAFLYNAFTATEGADLKYIYEMFTMILFPTFACVVILVLVYVLLRKRCKKKKTVMITMAIESIVILGVATTMLFSFFDVESFVKNNLADSKLIEEEYVNPKEVKMEFPKEKQNLIYIYLESMETTFMDKENGGNYAKNYIPELTKLCKENINFSTNAGVGGFRMILGADYTTASLFAQTTGLPLRVPMSMGEGFVQENFMAGAVGMGEILQEEGYRNYFMIGSEKEFGGRSSYLEQHGGYEIFDYQTAIDRGYIDKDYHVWWGFEDEKLFQYAKKELLEISKEQEPFNFSMLTVDTHALEGYQCRLCKDENSSVYMNSYSCSSRQVYEFVEWLKGQEFYENTTIVLCGDHYTMNSKFIEGDKENRRVYNTYMNALVEPVQSKNRECSALDMFPTTLAALGVTIPGERLGLGTNLFSEKQTIIEEMGWEAFETEIQKNSVFYNMTFLKE